MPNHPNRSRRDARAANPAPENVRRLREDMQRVHGLDITTAQDFCADMLHTSRRAWQQWEAGDRRMHPAFWELARRKTGRAGEHFIMVDGQYAIRVQGRIFFTDDPSAATVMQKHEADIWADALREGGSKVELLKITPGPATL